MSSTSSSSSASGALHIFLAVLRLLLWPVRYLLERTVILTAASAELDGLSPAVTAKASQQFVAHLKKLQQIKQKEENITHSRNSSSDSINSEQQQQHSEDILLSDLWTSSGFTAAREEAVESSALLFVYLHAPLHAKADTFCENMLLDSSFLQWLQRSSVIGLGVSIYSAQGMQLAQLLSATSFPFCALLQPKSSNSSSAARNRRPAASSSASLLFRAEGPALAVMSSTQLMSYLQHSLQQHERILAEQESRRLLRQQESDLRRQQDEEYLQTLAADQERARQQQEEEQRLKDEAAAAAARVAAEEKALEETLGKALSLMQPEPDQGSAGGCANIRFVLPTGTKLLRRFAPDQTVAALRAFLVVHFHEKKIDIKNIGLSSNFPRKTYNSEEDDNLTLVEAGIAPQAVLMVQDLDA